MSEENVAHSIILFLLSAALFFQDAESIRQRIVGGSPARPNQIPYQVSIQKLSFFWSSPVHFCGGAIISQFCVLTAGHCLLGYGPKNLIVKTGSINWKSTAEDDPGFQDHEIQELLPHPEYEFKGSEIKHDIGIIKLKSPINLNNSRHSSISLHEFNASEVLDNTPCQISGWGFTNENGKAVSDNLMVASVPIRNTTECRRKYAGQFKIFDFMICTGHDGGGISPCYGDSGGSLVCEGQLVGVTSFGIGCARAEYPAVFTKVSHYKEWIQSQNCFQNGDQIVAANPNEINAEPSLISKFINFVGNLVARN